MVIILAGGGSKDKAELIDKEFSAIIDLSKPVLYLPFARKPPYDECMIWFKSSYKKYGIKKIKMLQDPKEIDNINFEDYSAVYVGGGNTFRLIESLKNTSFELKLRKFLSKGGIYYGGSAGAVILGKTLSTTSSENEFKSTERGLNLLEGKSVACHYKDEGEEKMIEISKNEYSKIYAIPEDSAILIKGKKIKVIGKSPVQIISPGSINIV